MLRGHFALAHLTLDSCFSPLNIEKWEDPGSQVAWMTVPVLWLNTCRMWHCHIYGPSGLSAVADEQMRHRSQRKIREETAVMHPSPSPHPCPQCFSILPGRAVWASMTLHIGNWGYLTWGHLGCLEQAGSEALKLAVALVRDQSWDELSGCWSWHSCILPA